MVNITHKSNTLRQAIAIATVKVSDTATIELIQNRKIPKGDIFEFSRAAGLLAIKKTSDVIPDCHPLPVEYAAISYTVKNHEIEIAVEVHTIYKTGVEVEAMHGAAITALTMYDMLKPVDKGVEISTIRLLNKTGGKTDFREPVAEHLKCAVIICSDTAAVDPSKDLTGKKIIEQLNQYRVNTSLHEIVPDSETMIRQKARELAAMGFDLLLFAGGTGVSPKDITPDAIRPLLNRDLPGVMEAARSYGQQRTPYAMLSRGVAGFINKTLVITLPGSVKGATETIQALFPQVLHVFDVQQGKRHEQ